MALAPGKWIGCLARWQSMGHEQDEFADFYRASRDSCLRAVTAVVGDRELAEEQVAEAFTRAWTSWGQVRRHAAPRAWVVRTALNLGVSWWRRRHREVPLADHDAAVPAGPGDGVDPALIAALRRLPARQREVLAQHGIPSLVTVGSFCRSTPGATGFDQVVHPSTLADGSDVIVINGQAMPPGTRLSIGLFPAYTRMLLIEDRASLSCGSTSGQPAVHLIPSGTPSRG